MDLELLETVVQDTRDATTEELTRGEYNHRVDRARRVRRSSILRALHRSGYVLRKKNGRGLQSRTEPTSKPNARRSDSGSRR